MFCRSQGSAARGTVGKIIPGRRTIFMRDSNFQNFQAGGRKLFPGTREHTVQEFEGIPFEVVRRRVRYSRVEFKSVGLRVIVPRGVNPYSVLEQNRKSILNKYTKVMRQREIARKIPMTDWSAEEFREILTRYFEHYSKVLSVRPKKIKFRKMTRRWGSCRSDGTITLNVYLQFVPEHLIAYIIYHELAHFIVRGHNARFKALIAREFPHYRQLDKELNLYGVKLLS